MARKRRWIVLSLLLASCNSRPASYAAPGTLAIDRIERQLAGRPCIGALDGWERHYSFGLGGDYRSSEQGLERNRIVFAYLQAGVYGFRARRVIGEEGELGTDERQMRFARGEYDVPSGRLILHHCGWNADPQGRGAPVAT